MIDRDAILVLADGAPLSEAGKMDPFKRKSRLGPGPRGRSNAKRKKDRFRCKCSSQGSGTECKCKHKTGVKTVYVSYDYKNDYNSEYRRWASKKAKGRKAGKPKKKGLLHRAIGALKKVVGL